MIQQIHELLVPSLSECVSELLTQELLVNGSLRQVLWPKLTKELKITIKKINLLMNQAFIRHYIVSKEMLQATSWIHTTTKTQ